MSAITERKKQWPFGRESCSPSHTYFSSLYLQNNMHRERIVAAQQQKMEPMEPLDPVGCYRSHYRHSSCTAPSETHLVVPPCADQPVLLFCRGKGPEHALVLLLFCNVCSYMAAAWQDPDVSGELSRHNNLPLRDQKGSTAASPSNLCTGQIQWVLCSSHVSLMLSNHFKHSSPAYWNTVYSHMIFPSFWTYPFPRVFRCLHFNSFKLRKIRARVSIATLTLILICITIKLFIWCSRGRTI